MKKFFGILLTTLLLSGCGFGLKDHWTVAQRYQCLHVTTPNRYSNFSRELRKVLVEHHVCVTDNPERQCPTLHIIKAEIKNDPPTIGTINTARVYRYYITVEYQLDGQPVDGIIASRFTTLNAGILTTTNNQISLVEQGLIDDAIRQLMFRLSR